MTARGITLGAAPSCYSLDLAREDLTGMKNDLRPRYLHKVLNHGCSVN